MKFSTISKSEVTSLAIGGFDGIHLAHQALLKRLDNFGALMVINKYNSDLTPGGYRRNFIKFPCFFYELKNIKELKKTQFASFLKKEFPKLKKIVVGYDFRFGKDRCCTSKDLSNFFEVEVVDEVIVDNISVHSGIIREFIQNGKIKKANKFLGRAYSIVGEVMCGQGLGKKELVPTINVNIKDFLLPNEGTYATKTKIDSTFYNSVTFTGVRHSTDGNFSIETHLIDANIQLQCQKIEIFFYQKIRDNKRFNSLSELKKQIQNDINKAKEIINECKT